MNTKFNDLEQLAMELTKEERALLAEHLIVSLENEECGNFEEAWAKEAESRYQGYLSGELQAKEANEVMENARNRLG